LKYISTNKQSETITFQEAVLSGMPFDNGLYMPQKIPRFNKKILDNLKQFKFEEISFLIAKQFIEDEINDEILYDIINKTIQFDAPIVKLENKKYILELFHGPTFAFKDFGARFMARTMEYFVRDYDNDLNILVATSGDTGSAVADGFYNVQGINVIVLYPSGKVSDIQEKQMTTLGNNIYTLEVEGTFDDCQSLVKQGFLDKELRRSINITSANSINISRLIPQTFYYFWGVIQLPTGSRKVFSVPSGNFGNVAAAIISKKMGLPIDTLIASTNSNDAVPKYLNNYKYVPKPSIETISNAMDVGDPSNIQRINQIYNNNPKDILNDMYSWSFSDSETIESIRNTYEKFNYIADPHTAVGILGYEKYIKEVSDNQIGVILSTAHAAKFKNVIKDDIDFTIDIPNSLKKVLTKKKLSIKIQNSYNHLKEFIKSI